MRKNKKYVVVKNPVYIPIDRTKIKSPIPKARKKKTRVQIADDKERSRKYKVSQYKERAKRLRPFFKDNFGAAQGFDLRKPESWTNNQKAKVTKYFRVMAPHITGDFLVKRYHNKENEQAAFDASLQEQRLKGQTAIAFRLTDSREKLEVIVKKGKATIKQNGIEKIKILFDRAAFLKDPDAEIERALAETDANVFRVIVGGTTQLKALTREDVKSEMKALLKNYSPAKVKRRHGQRSYTEWLNGLIAYPGSVKPTYTSVEKFVIRQERIGAKNEIARLNKLSIDRGGKGFSRTIDEQVAIRRERKSRR